MDHTGTPQLVRLPTSCSFPVGGEADQDPLLCTVCLFEDLIHSESDDKIPQVEIHLHFHSQIFLPLGCHEMCILATGPLGQLFVLLVLHALYGTNELLFGLAYFVEHSH